MDHTLIKCSKPLVWNESGDHNRSMSCYWLMLVIHRSCTLFWLPANAPRRHFSRMPTPRFATVRSKLKKCEHVWGPGPCTGIPAPVNTQNDRQTEATENITFATPLSGFNYTYPIAHFVFEIYLVSTENRGLNRFRRNLTLTSWK